jgi:uncharacterized protein YegL
MVAIAIDPRIPQETGRSPVTMNFDDPFEGGLSARPLHIFFMLDASTSMLEHGKIETLNRAMREAIPAIRDASEEHPHVRVLMRAMVFGNDARWLGPEQASVSFQWDDIVADGRTAMGEALSLLAEELDSPSMPHHLLPPVVILMSDGDPTDDFEAGLARLERARWVDKAIRIPIAIGSRANQDVLLAFMSPSLRASGVLQANNSRELVAYVKWASVAASTMAMQGIASEVVRHKVLIPPQVDDGGDDPWVDFN